MWMPAPAATVAEGRRRPVTSSSTMKTVGSLSTQPFPGPLCLPKTPSALLPQAGFTCFVNWDVGSYDATPQIPN